MMFNRNMLFFCFYSVQNNTTNLIYVSVMTEKLAQIRTLFYSIFDPISSLLKKDISKEKKKQKKKKTQTNKTERKQNKMLSLWQ